MSAAGSQENAGRPLWLLAELSYRCPLHCVYCSNPVDYARMGGELATGEWLSVLRQARDLGALQLGFSGGEPLVREDLEELVGAAHDLGYYTNLITSGLGLSERRAALLRQNGLDQIQLSFQDAEAAGNDWIGRARTFELKLQCAALIKRLGYPMVLNVVLHRRNIDHVERILAMAERIGADYLELANTQYYGWALLNRDHLLPTREQLARAEEAVGRFRQRHHGGMRVYYVVPDYYETRPKACMNGWGAVFLTVAADGTALPCHQARSLPGINFPNVRDADVEWIWYRSPAFNRFRGFEWMKEPCRSCPERMKDFGGCRCQAYLLAGDASGADPVCDQSPHRARVDQAIAQAQDPQAPLYFRDDKTSREFTAQRG